MGKKVEKVDVPASACNELGEQIRAFLSEDGRKEIGDPVPLAPPAGLSAPLTTEERFRRIIRSEHLARIAEAQDMDTFDEADDFDIEDDPAPPPTLHEMEALEGENRNQLRSALRNNPRRKQAGGGEEEGSPNKPSPAPAPAQPPEEPSTAT